MPRHRIYADFNGLDYSSRDSRRVALSLHYRGTVQDLSRLQVQLRENLEIVVYSDSDETQDLEADATVFFDRARDHWFAEFDQSQIREVPRPEPVSGPDFPCFSCGRDLTPQIRASGLAQGDCCAQCSEPVFLPIRSPE